MSNIFISYSSEDREKARQMAHALEQEGWSVWWDRNIAAGKSYQRVIESELDAADCAIVIWSRNSVYSDWVVAEAEEGRTRSILVPVSIDDAKPPLVFRQIQTADLSSWDGDPTSAMFRQLVDDVRPLIPESATVDPENLKPLEKPKKQDTPDTPGTPEIPNAKTGKWILLAAVVLVGVAALVAWPYIQTWLKPDPMPSAAILKFGAEPMQIKEGEAATLNWSTVNAVRVTIRSADDPEAEIMPESGSRAVSPKRTTEYVLTAQGKDPDRDAATALITITVAEPEIAKAPEIVVFETDRRILVRGDSTALHWETVHADRVELDDAVVNPRGDIKIRPEQTTTYRLIALNSAGQSDRRTITITVEDMPRDEVAEIQELLGMLGFDAGTADGLPGPRTRAAIEAFQNQNGLTITGLPSRDLAERLREIHRSAPAPEIVVFKSDRLKIKKGETLSLFWETVNADRVNLKPLGQVQPSGKRSVQPPVSTEYELRAFNRLGRSVRKTIAIEVGCSPIIDELRADSYKIDQGSKTILYWKTSCVDKVFIRPLSKEYMKPEGRIAIAPDKTTTYILTALGPDKQSTHREVTIAVHSATVSGRVFVLAGGGKYLEDKQVIRAIYYGLPLQQLMEKLFGNSPKSQAYFEFPLGSKRLSAGKFSSSIKRGRKLMKDAGYAGGIKANLVYTPNASDLAKIVADLLDRIGIYVDANPVDPDRARKYVEDYIAKTGRPTFLLELRK